MKIPPLSAEDLNRPDDELGKLLLGWYVFAEAEKRGTRPDEVSEEFTRHVISLVPQIEATAARLTTIEKVLRKAAAGEFTTAGRLLKEHMLDSAFDMAARDEAATRRRWLQSIASKDRGDGLAQVILKLVRNTNGKITEAELRTEIEASQGGEFIDEVTEDRIYFINRDGTGGHSSPISALRSRLSRAKKKYRELSAR